MNHGKLVVVFIFLVALAMAVFAWTFQTQRTRQALRFWGAETALLVRQAPTVELWRLSEAPASDEKGALAIDGRTLHVIGREDISRAAGLANARAALMQDASFAFDGSRGACQPQWSHALRFERGGQEALVAIDFACGRIRIMQGEREAAMGEKLAAGLRTFLEERR